MNKGHVFLQQYNARVAFTLDCFDRVIFKGHLRQVCYPQGVCRFVDATLGDQTSRLHGLGQNPVQRIIDHAESLARQADCPYVFLRGH